MGVMKELSLGGRGMGGPRGGRTFFEVAAFFDKPAVMSAVDKATRKVLSRFGAFVRQSAMRSIKKPRRKRLNEMSPEERKLYEPKRDTSGRFVSQKTKEGRVRKRPFAAAEPGKPPRNQTGRLKATIFFRYDRSAQGVYIGPSRTGGGDRMGALELGGLTMSKARGAFRIHPHPFMRPALAKELPKLPAMWHNSVRTI